MREGNLKHENVTSTVELHGDVMVLCELSEFIGVNEEKALQHVHEEKCSCQITQARVPKIMDKQDQRGAQDGGG